MNPRLVAERFSAAARRRATVEAAIRYRAALARRRGGFLRGDNAARRYPAIVAVRETHDALRGLNSRSPEITALIAAIQAEHQYLIRNLANPSVAALHRAGRYHLPSHHPLHDAVRVALAVAVDR